MIRPVEAGDLSELYAVCLATGAAGNDAAARFANPNLLGEVYVGPYVVLGGTLGFVFEDNQGLAGYVLGAVDTLEFEARCEREWWPALRSRYPKPASIIEGADLWDDEILGQVWSPAITKPSMCEIFPAHLHIDLLPRLQGTGMGRKMLESLLNALVGQGAVGVHLGVDVTNERAIGFYTHLGFEAIEVVGDTMMMGRGLTEATQTG